MKVGQYNFHSTNSVKVLQSLAVACFAKLVKANLRAVWAQQNAPFTHFLLPRLAWKESKVSELNGCDTFGPKCI